MHKVREEDIGNSRDDIRGNPEAFGFMVPGDLVGDLPEKRRQCAGVETNSRSWKLSNRMDLVAQAAQGDGAARTGSAFGNGPSGRNLY